MAIIGLLLSPTEFLLGSGSFWNDLDHAIVDWIASTRSDALATVARALDVAVSPWVLRVLGWATLVTLVLVKRWRHLFAFTALLLVLRPLLYILSNVMARPRVDGIEILGSWNDFAFPSLPIASLTMSLVGIAYVLVPAGRHRRYVLLSVSGVVAAVGSARIYLAVDRLTDGLAAAILAATTAVLVFRIWTPEAVFPVEYSRRKTAHLEMTESRRRAILAALRDQVGLDAVDVELFGLEASGGSSPLLITLSGDEEDRVFAKLYAQNHVRSDRWYKLGRSLLYGALEDEHPFRSVKALAEYEDYIMRLMHAAGVPAPRSYGIVEITPGREYLLVTEFIPASEISKADVDDAVVDAALGAVRSMWDAGLAHRDIKPGNLLVRGEEVFVIDAAFGETRPSAWREAVDLANMMLTLSLRTTPDRVYEAAIEYFSEAEIAEALAATRGVTIPSELKRALAEDDREILGELRRLAPSRTPVRIQRWTRRRLASLATIGALAASGSWLVAVNLTVLGNLL